jgi:outer membrane protein OmpU
VKDTQSCKDTLNLTKIRKQTMHNTFKLAAVSSAALMIAAAPALAEGPTLKLGGYYDQKLSISEEDDNRGTTSDVDVRNDVEIYFLGAATLDNGIKIRTRVELEGGTVGDGQRDAGNVPNGADDNAFDQIDEAFMTISGSFGSIKVGHSDTAAKGMTTGLQGSWISNVGENLAFNTSKLFSRQNGGANGAIEGRGTPAAQMDLNSDGEQISYTTPSMGGLQVAVGYAPNDRETFDGQEGANSIRKDDIFDIGIRYMGKTDQASYRIGGGMATANNNNVVGEDDSIQWIAGGSVRIGAFQLALSYSEQESENTNGVETLEGVNTLEGGIRYWMGANQFSVAFSQSEVDSTRADRDNDEETVIVVGHRMALGKGIRWHNSIWFYDAEDGNPNKLPTTDNDGMAFTTGLRVGF